MRGLGLGLSINRRGNSGPQFGSELISNGSFASDTVWTKGAGWTISGGTGNATAATSTISSNTGMGLSTSKTYRVTFDVVNFSSGGVIMRLGNNTLNTSGVLNANGTYTYDVQPSNVATDDVAFFAGSPATLGIDNVSVREKYY